MSTVDSSTEALARAIEAAKAAWPGVVVSDEAFGAFVRARAGDATLADALRDLAATDLYLACACATGDAAPITAFERRYFPEIGAVLARVRDATIAADDVKQALREKLFVGERPRSPSTQGKARSRRGSASPRCAWCSTWCAVRRKSRSTARRSSRSRAPRRTSSCSC